MTVESDIDDQVAKVTIRKDKAIRVKGDLDALVTEGTSIAALTTTTAVSTLAVRTEATSLSTAATALATSAVGASSFADLSALAASKSETATDVFIYDTSLDSDGGAWRFRTQGTSWYNETLNTAIRGSRREFPAVAVVVATSSTVTIYDGDTPGLPMWMVFNAAYGTSLDTGNSVRTVWAVNAVLTVGSQNAGLGVVNWLADHTTRYRSNNSPLRVNAISGRAINGALGISGPSLVSSNVNDVAMTVLPNAPIDSATGLPVPTIFVQTGGGLSRIAHDGTITNASAIGWPDAYMKLAFSGDYLVSIGGGDGFYNYMRARKVSDLATTAWIDWGVKNLRNANFPGTIYGASYAEKAFITNRSFVHHAPDLITPTKGMECYVSSSSISGWMPGDTKGAWLSDMSDADLLGKDLVTNGDFSNGTTGWSTYNGNGSVVAGAYNFTPTIAYGGPRQAVTLTVGRIYLVTATVTGNALARLYVNNTVGTPTVVTGTTAQKTITFFCVGLNTAGEFVVDSGNSLTPFTVDNVSIRLADADRSVNDIGLNIVGRIQRTPVADNADLVAYTGFSATNYLEQPYNSTLDFGTGDFSIMGWGKTNMNGTFLSRGDGLTAGSWYWSHLGGITTTLYIHDGTTFRLAMNLPLPSAEMTHFVLVRRSGTISLYGNGQLVGSNSGADSARTITNTTAKLRIGEQQHVSYVNPASRLALLRISATAPSADQIAKIYKDERKLFEPGARCTLHGSSDAVTALAYDKVTNLLHVGTSAGRSVFDGLVRVSNTTTPVRAVIAAHGGLVIED